jgi:cold-inducible RNA-binding protein
MNIYVGNLAYTATQEQLMEAFSAFGRVNSVKIIIDRETGNPRGFAFVEMSDNDEALKAIQGLNGAEIGGRAISANEARPRPEGGGGGGGRGPGGGGRGGYGGGGGGGGGPRNRW